MKKLIILGLLCLSFLILPAQDEASWVQKPNFDLSGFVDVFFVYDFSQPPGTSRQPFLYNHNRHSEFNLNLGLISLGVEHPQYRSKLSLQTGTYANDNYAAEPEMLKSIFEAHVGVALNRQRNLWLDAGIFPSHIGFESAISMENWTLTRSLAAENSPYFLSGAKLTFTPSDTWEMAAVVCNGWQRIQRVPGQSLLSLGTQLTFTPSEKVNLNWSTFWGTDDPDSLRRLRYFNNLYGLFQFNENWGLIAGFDLGVQQSFKGSSTYHTWLAPVLIGQFTFSPRWKTALRAEYYRDETGIIIATQTANGFQTTGLSWNLDYSPVPVLVWRLEGRWFHSRDKIFASKNTPSANNFFIGTSLALKLLAPN
jgi:hypothetical protein